MRRPRTRPKPRNKNLIRRIFLSSKFGHWAATCRLAQRTKDLHVSRSRGALGPASASRKQTEARVPGRPRGPPAEVSASLPHPPCHHQSPPLPCGCQGQLLFSQRPCTSRGGWLCALGSQSEATIEERGVADDSSAPARSLERQPRRRLQGVYAVSSQVPASHHESKRIRITKAGGDSWYWW
jgi:hypothetical protein